MDKYEFNIKVEQIKKMVSRGDYGTAMKIADTIDWHRVRNASLLSMIAQIYEKNEEYQEAKDILLLAFERAPVGKRLLYKLADLALKDGSTAEAEAYYREFCDLAQDDPRQYLLRYKILKAKKAPVDQLIRALEVYTASEVDEKWLYELAELYHKAGIEDKCVATCDRIMLLFGLGKYVDKAMDLKLQYAPLNKYQMDLVENREKYEAKLRAVEEEYNGGIQRQDDYENGTPDSEVSKQVAVQIHEDAQARKLADEVSRISEEDGQTAEVEEDDDMGATRTLGDLRVMRENRQPEPPQEAVVEEDTIPTEQEREIERQKMAIRAAKEREEMEEEALRRAEEEREAARREEEERRAKKQAEIDRERARRSQVRNIPAEVEEDDEDDLELESLDDMMMDTNNLMIEAETDEEGLAMAVDSLKEIHRELGVKNPVAKISSEKLNKRGISAIADKLVGKDLVIMHAAGLTDAVQNELDDLMEKDRSGMIVVLIDTPKNLEELHAYNTSLASKFQYIGSEKEEHAEQKAAEDELEEALKRSTEKQEQIARDVVSAETQMEEEPAKEEIPEEEPEYEEEESDGPEPELDENEDSEENYEDDYEEDEPEEYVPPKKKKFFARPEKQEKPVREEKPEEPEVQEEPKQTEEPAAAAEENVVPSDYDNTEEMDPDEFAQYACKYAADIDCSITGKSLLALYERIEMMEEDGEHLTRTAAVDLIEEAADKAEKKTLGKKLAGLFSPTYTKEGLLILHEKDFFD